ncbi:hypothetical protein EYF80_026104 [Liparis tanakae]|uniref:Uncharacterized protein n=1 Tax=Liparis tanakae TaxID=230148 RepID=A0A4Z2HD99_9TELE|nr:hypothetical protein EYF80_026104 [Liparis tanakae]
MENFTPSSEEKEPMGDRVPDVSTMLCTNLRNGVEAPEAECEDFCLDSGAVALPLVWPNKALGIRRIRGVDEAQHHEEIFQDYGGSRADGLDLNCLPFDGTMLLFLQHCCQTVVVQSVAGTLPGTVLNVVGFVQHHDLAFQVDLHLCDEVLNVPGVLESVDPLQCALVPHPLDTMVVAA